MKQLYLYKNLNTYKISCDFCEIVSENIYIYIIQQVWSFIWKYVLYKIYLSLQFIRHSFYNIQCSILFSHSIHSVGILQRPNFSMHIDVLNTEIIFIISLTSGVVINRLVLTVFDVYQEMDIICLQTKSRRF